ncbi:MAG: hypothetical protein ACOC22_02000 [bacterium]
MENRASKYYKHFVDVYIFYCQIFETAGNPKDILELPYPFFRDVIEAQVKEKKDEKRRIDNQKQKTKNFK